MLVLADAGVRAGALALEGGLDGLVRHAEGLPVFEADRVGEDQDCGGRWVHEGVPGGEHAAEGAADDGGGGVGGEGGQEVVRVERELL